MAILIVTTVMCVFVYLAKTHLLAHMSGWHEWTDFTVPPKALALPANIRVQGQVIIVCNSGEAPWGHTLIRISGEYLAELKTLEAGKCKNLSVQDFKTNSWKRMPPPKDFYVGDVEILANIREKAYAKWRVSDSR